MAKLVYADLVRTQSHLTTTWQQLCYLADLDPILQSNNGRPSYVYDFRMQYHVSIRHHDMSGDHLMQHDVHHFLSCDGDCVTCLQGCDMLGYVCQHVVGFDSITMA